MPKVIVCLPTIRPESHAKFCEAWKPLFEKHKATLITVWDGEEPRVTIQKYPFKELPDKSILTTEDIHSAGVVWGKGKAWKEDRDLFYRFTDGCRNIGSVAAAQLMDSPDDVLITMDDDVTPVKGDSYALNGTVIDPIRAHIDALSKRVPISWMNTAHDTDLYLRGFPYGIREEAPVMMSHGVWVGVPDFDGETQLKLEYCTGCSPNESGIGSEHCGLCRGTGKMPIPYSLPYYVGPIPKGVLMPICGMNLAVKRDAIPYLYFAPMGKDTGIEGLNRFADIWMGVFAKRAFDKLGWAVYTGASTILHTRASDARKNFEQEKLGREWNEKMPDILDWYESLGDGADGVQTKYFRSYADKRGRFKNLIQSIIEKGGGK